MIDCANLLNLSHPLNQGLVAEWACLPGLSGGAVLHNLKNPGIVTADGLAGVLTPAASGPTWSGLSPPGGYGSLKFDGTDDYVSITDATALRPSSVTLSAFIYLTSNPSFACVFCKPYTSAPWSSPYVSWMLRINSSTSIEYDVGNGTTYSANAKTVTALVAGRWYHVALTYDRTTVTGYLNGLSVGTNTAVSGDIGYAAHPALIGADYSASPAGDYFPGHITSASVYNRALSADEVRDLYVETSLGNPNRYRYLSRSPWLRVRGAEAAGGPLVNFLNPVCLNGHFAGKL